MCSSNKISSSAYLPEIKRWSLTLIFATLATDLSYFLIYGQSLAKWIFISKHSLDNAIYQTGIVLVISAIFLWISGWLPLSKKEKTILGSTGILLALWFWLVGADDRLSSASTLACTLLLPTGYFLAFKALFSFFQNRENPKETPHWIPVFFWISLAIIGIIAATAAMLRVNAALLPLTYDAHLYRIDKAFNGLAQHLALWYGDGQRAIPRVVYFVYDLLGFLLFPLIALTIRNEKSRSLNVWRTLLLPYAAAVVCYAWLPATGPGPSLQGYPGNTSLADIPSSLLSVGLAPRNAMPSMHLSTAIWIFMLTAALRQKWVWLLSIFFVIGTIWSTLALGEHYVIDLVVALPFAAAMGIWLISPPNWSRVAYWAKVLQWGTAGIFVLWMFLLRFSPEWLENNPDIIRILGLTGLIASSMLIQQYIRCVWRDEDVQDHQLPRQAWQNPAMLPVELKGNYWLVGIFFFSGFAGLVYEVVYAKALGVTFGGTALAANTVLMTYMGGMALGAWLGGILAERSKQPLLLYAGFEAGIGIYAALTPTLFSGIQALYVALATDSPPDAAWLTGLRMALGAAVLGVPTVLMGATLPLVFQCLRGMGIPTARAIAPLYAANVLGAAVGALAAGYVLLPAVGRNGGTLLAAVISLMIALYVIDKIKQGNGQSTYTTPLPADTDMTAETAVSARQGAAALTVLVIGGIVTLALEVVFMHLLAVVAGNSVYAFGLMLATFLTGLGLGSGIGERLMLHMDRARLVLIAQCGVALSILLTAFVWDGLADYMASFAYVERQGLFLDFSARELVRALVCAIAMMPPALFIGMSYPAAIGLAADWLAEARYKGIAARGVGLASGLNTLGNIAGVLLAGFWWLPAYGSRNVLLGLAVVAVLLAALMARVASMGTSSRAVHWSAVGGMAAALLLFPAHWNLTTLSTGANVYFFPQQWGEVIDHAESVEGGLTTVTDNQGVLTLLTNGKFQGNNAQGGEMVAQESFALIPLMHTTQRKETLVIGYGTGMTARVLQDQGFRHLDVVELSRDIVEMADKHFPNINDGISSHPAVKMHYTDGRNYLLTQTRKYDLISLEISSIWFAGAANLYNKEFYELANKRLSDQGILQQWVQLHHMRTIDFLYILGSARSVFKNVWVYVSGGQGIIVASNEDSAKNNEAAIQKLLTSHTISSIDVKQLPRTLIAEPTQVDALLQRFDPSMSFFVSTDKNLYLEYATPKGNAMRTDSMPVLIDLLQGK